MMDLSEGKKLHGFTVRRVRYVEELSATLVEMTHDRLGSELCWVDNGNENKLFSVAFKTLPEDNTGVFHILEHSVLCGSEKYPVKEPFVELLKSSMNTFLNAMTYPDKTVYPVSSRNRTDFLNLTSVYLDAVFAPRLLENPNIFYQEGRHIEWDEAGTPSYKGVVYNEMKGAMSDVKDRMDICMNGLLFPENCYRFNSGGDPAAIPELSYEQFKETYRRFYHPSNASFFLDGDVPLDETLAMIDAYLCRFEKKEIRFEIPMQTPVSGEASVPYEISGAEAGKDRAMLSLGKIIASWEDRPRQLAVSVLCNYLSDSNESPLKRAVLSSGLAEDVEMGIMTGIAQPYFMMTFTNMKDENSDALRGIVRKTAEKLLKEGLNRDELTASINRLSFRSRQMQEPQGLGRAIRALSSTLYGGDPLLYLTNNSAIAVLREMAENGDMDSLLREMLLDESGLCVLHMLPSVTLGNEQREEEGKRLQARLAAMSSAEQESLKKAAAALSSWQQTPDSEEQLATLPTLPLREVSEKPEAVFTEEIQENGVTVWLHKIPSNGIVYLSLYFSLGDYSLSELTQLEFLTTLLGNLPTEHYSAAALRKAVKTYIGQLNFSVAAYAQEKQTESCMPYFAVHAGVLQENFETAAALICEILTGTVFDVPERIREYLVQEEEAGRQATINSGHALGLMLAASHYTAECRAAEAISGYTYLAYLHRFVRDFESESAAFIAVMKRTQQTVFSRARLTASVTGSDLPSVMPVLSRLPEGLAVSAEACYPATALPKRAGIRIPAQTAFAVKAYNTAVCGNAGTGGSGQVAANILSLSYLWNTVRAQGGAYGAGMRLRKNGVLFCYSYRDPSPAAALKAYDSASGFLRTFCHSGETVDKYIISAIAAADYLKTPQEQGQIADILQFTGTTDEQRLRDRKEMLETTKEELEKWCDVLDTMAAGGAICVVGHEDALRACEGLGLTVLEL